jgi:hypothetical protein
MVPNLDFWTLRALLRTVFALRAEERGLLLLVDLPDAARPDHPRWQDRRRIAAGWYAALRGHRAELPFADLALAVYPNVGSDNRDLPAEVVEVAEVGGEDLLAARGRPVPLEDLLGRASVVLAPTQFSATAPLKVAARRLGFRGATLPDFRREMIPTLALDWEAVDERVVQLAERLDRATAAHLDFAAGGTAYSLALDLRFRTAHRSSGLLREPGTVGNLPSGEAYIVPYEGERPGEPSRSAGVLPVELSGEVVFYRIAANRAVEVLSEGPRSAAEREALAAEPAYGNLAELGLGVLSAWGIRAVGSILLDEKLGLHVAFGRSDHFGGATSPASFRDPAKVVHIDRVYVPECQPQVAVRRAALAYEDGAVETILEDGRYVV